MRASTVMLMVIFAGTLAVLILVRP
jgi:hypothetical protein